MEVAMPMSGTAIDCYEDMFKEITRKLYGEDGLPEAGGGNERLAASSESNRGLTPIDYDVDNTPILKPEEHFTAFGLAALMQNGFPPSGILNSSFPSHKPTGIGLGTVLEDKWIINDDFLQWTQSKIATYNPSQKVFRCAECDCVGYLPRVAEHWLGTHSNLRAFHCPQCPYESAWARCVRLHLSRQHNINTDESSDTLTKNNPVLQEINKYLQRLKTKVETSGTNKSNHNLTAPGGSSNATASSAGDDFHNQIAAAAAAAAASSSSTTTTNNNNTTSSTSSQQRCSSSGSDHNSGAKRYTCTYCPYATDRRDLFTRHENIHREEKPFQCYVCQKQFNRADHVKKHFLRMHREHPYDLNRIRRHPPKNASGMSYYQKYNSQSTPHASTPAAPVVPPAAPPPDHSLSIPNTFNNLTRINQPTPRLGQSTAPPEPKSTGACHKSASSKSSKKKGEKRFTCCYCSWSGVDNWCLKRHMNTHLKPFVCGLCDYKAARSERLATHVLKVHNKRACSKCSFLADDLTQLTAHQQEHHPLEQRNRGGSGASAGAAAGSNVLSSSSFNNTASNSVSSTTCGPGGHGIKSHELSSASLLHHHHLQQQHQQQQNHLHHQQQQQQQHHHQQHPGHPLSNLHHQHHQHHHHLQPVGNRFLESKSWKNHSPKQHGAARLFNYMEASDGSEPEYESTTTSHTTSHSTDNNMSKMSLSHRVQSDFHEAGDVGSQVDDEVGDEIEIPLFVCLTCGCEFEDDISLETHQYTHRHTSTSPAKPDDSSKENVDPDAPRYRCRLCYAAFDSQSSIMDHLLVHSSLMSEQRPTDCHLPLCKRSRKQTQPKKIVLPFWDSDEVEVLRRFNGKLRRWRGKLKAHNSGFAALIDKYMAQLVTRRGLACITCRNNGLIRYHTKASLSLHHRWRHLKRQYRCEHCDMLFRHRYQCVLHSSREHAGALPITLPRSSPATTASTTTPSPPPSSSSLPTTEPKLLVPADIRSSQNLLSHPGPIAATPHSTTKLGMTFFDHSSSLLHSSPSSSINNHMPIIIPTFPPN